VKVIRILYYSIYIWVASNFITRRVKLNGLFTYCHNELLEPAAPAKSAAHARTKTI